MGKGPTNESTPEPQSAKPGALRAPLSLHVVVLVIILAGVIGYRIVDFLWGAELREYRRWTTSQRTEARKLMLWRKFAMPDSDWNCCGLSDNLPQCVPGLDALRVLREDWHDSDAHQTFAECPAAIVYDLSGDPGSIQYPIPTLDAALHSPDKNRQRIAAGLLRNVTNVGLKTLDPAIELLEISLRSNDSEMFRGASTALYQWEKQIHEPPAAGRPPVNMEQRERTMRHLRWLVGENGSLFLKDLITCVRDADCQDRAGSVWALGQMGPDAIAAVEPVMNFLQEQTGYTYYPSEHRSVALKTLLAMTEGNEELMSRRLFSSYRITDSSLVRHTLLEGMVHFEERRGFACTKLVTSLESGDVGQVELSSRTLTTAGPRCAVAAPKLVRLLGSSNALTRGNAARVIKSMGSEGRIALLRRQQRGNNELLLQTEIEKALDGTFTFGTGRIRVDPAQVARFDGTAQLGRSNECKKLIVEGHADSIGSKRLNRRLAQARANAVKAQLMELGVPAEKIETVSLGESSPLVGNRTRADRALNRRVEVRCERE